MLRSSGRTTRKCITASRTPPMHTNISKFVEFSSQAQSMVIALVFFLQTGRNMEVEVRLDRSKSMEILRIRSVMCVPLKIHAQVGGVIYVDSVDKPYGFRNEDLTLLTALSNSASMAIENALHFSYPNTEKSDYI